MSTTRSQLLNDNEEAMRIVLDYRQSGMWTAMPGIVEAVNLTEMTCSVQPSIQGTITLEDGSQKNVNLPLLIHVPIVFPSGGGFAMTFPVAPGDEVLVVFGSRCIDSWWQLGDVQVPMEARMHDLSDGFAIPGPRSQPNVLASISADHLQIRTTSGTTYIQLGSNGKMNLVNSTTNLNEVLVTFEGIINTFMGVLAAFGGGSTPVTQAMLQTPAQTAVTALAPLLVKIQALLG